VDRVEGHGLAVGDVEDVVNNAGRPFPKADRQREMACDRATPGGSVIQGMYLVDADGTLFVIHARPLRPKERRRRRRR
jgi:hypothetical protein